MNKLYRVWLGLGSGSGKPEVAGSQQVPLTSPSLGRFGLPDEGACLSRVKAVGFRILFYFAEEGGLSFFFFHGDQSCSSTSCLRVTPSSSPLAAQTYRSKRFRWS